MNPVIEAIRRLSVEQFTITRSREAPFSVREGDVSVLCEHSFFTEETDLFVNMHLLEPPIPLPRAERPRLHKHDFYELIYVHEGAARNTVRSRGRLTELHMGKGDICLLNPNAEHRLEISRHSDVAFNILIKKHFFNQGFQEVVGENNPLHSFFTDSMFEQKEANHYLLFENRLCPTMGDSAFALITEYANAGIDSPIKLKGYLFLLFADLLAAYRNGLDEGSVELPSDQKISDILSYIIKNYRTVSLSETAQHFHYHAQYLSRLLKRYTQKSFSELLREVRMKKAVSLLTRTSLTIGEITEQIGMQDAYFYKLFHQQYGCSPAQFRKNRQNRPVC